MLNRRDFTWGAAMSVGAMTAMSSEVKAEPEPTMSLNVIYPNQDGARFDTIGSIRDWVNGNGIKHLSQKIILLPRSLIDSAECAGPMTQGVQSTFETKPFRWRMICLSGS